MKLFGDILYTFGMIVIVLIDWLLYVLSSLWVVIVWIKCHLIEAIWRNKLIFAAMLVSWLVFFVYLIALITRSYQ